MPTALPNDPTTCLAVAEPLSSDSQAARTTFFFILPDSQPVLAKLSPTGTRKLDTKRMGMRRPLAGGQQAGASLSSLPTPPHGFRLAPCRHPRSATLPPRPPAVLMELLILQGKGNDNTFQKALNWDYFLYLRRRRPVCATTLPKRGQMGSTYLPIYELSYPPHAVCTHQMAASGKMPCPIY